MEDLLLPIDRSGSSIIIFHPHAHEVTYVRFRKDQSSIE